MIVVQHGASGLAGAPDVSHHVKGCQAGEFDGGA
jgi:hypothetical protein